MSFDPFSFESDFRRRLYFEISITNPLSQAVLSGADASKERIAEAIAKAREADPEGMQLLAEHIDFGRYVEGERDAAHDQAMRELKDEI